MTAPSIDEIAAAYAAVPYRHGAIHDTHPARLGAIGRLHGLHAARPDHCRVLELGCGECLNLLPLAERLPKSEFVGVELSPDAIRRGEFIRTECGIANARLICSDLRDWEPDGEYDYIIAHGVYSWVPAPIRDRLLAIVACALAPSGIAYISYNTLPGWSLPHGIRTVLLQEVRAIPEPQQKIEHARKVLTTFLKALESQPGAYQAHLRLSLEDMLGKPGDLFFHDELEPVNEPCTFTAFVDHAASHQLHYLAEAHYATMPFQHVPEAARLALGGLQPDFLQQQQFMDVLFQRWSRNSLLCRLPSPPREATTPDHIREFAIGARLHLPSGPMDLSPGIPVVFVAHNGLQLPISDSAEKAALVILGSAAPVRVPFTDLLAKTNTLLASASLPAVEDPSSLCHFFLRLFSLDALDLLLAGDGEWLALSERPAPSPLMRGEARQGLQVTNRWHETIALTVEGARSLAELQGTANPAAIDAGLAV